MPRNRKITPEGYYSTAPEAIAERTAGIIANFRGLPGEFYMLKGLLCLEHGIEAASPNYETVKATRGALRGLFDRMAIAERMDEINRAALDEIRRDPAIAALRARGDDMGERPRA